MSSNVIDLSERRKKRDNDQTPIQESHATPIVDMTARREAELESDRRKVKRTILTEFVGTYVVLPNIGLQKIALFDVSMSGISFDLDYNVGRFNIGEQIAVRVYLNKTTYFPFVVSIANVRDVRDEGVFRHGATIVEGTVNDEALQHFINFIETVSTSLKRDKGDVMVGNQTK